MDEVLTSTAQWTISARGSGEVLAVHAGGPFLCLGLLGSPAGFTADEVEGWLKELVGMAEATASDAGPTTMPRALHQALTGLLFYEAELWGGTGSRGPCSLAFHASEGTVSFGWAGSGTIEILLDGEPVDPAWMIVRDEQGREARAFVADAHSAVRVRAHWPAAPDGADACSKMIEAGWPGSPARTSAPDSGDTTAAEMAAESLAAAPAESAADLPKSPTTRPARRRGFWHFRSWMDRLAGSPVDPEPIAHDVPGVPDLIPEPGPQDERRAAEGDNTPPIAAEPVAAEASAPDARGEGQVSVEEPLEDPVDAYAAYAPLVVLGGAVEPVATESELEVAAVDDAAIPLEMRAHELDLPRAPELAEAKPTETFEAAAPAPVELPIPAPVEAVTPPVVEAPATAEAAAPPEAKAMAPAPAEAMAPPTIDATEPAATEQFAPEEVESREPAAPLPSLPGSEPSFEFLEESVVPRRPRPVARRPAWPEPEETANAGPRPLWRHPWVVTAFVVVLFGAGWMLGRVDLSGAGKGLGSVFKAIGLGPARYEVAVTSRPAGAWIIVDGVSQTKRTPTTLELKPGSHEVVLTTSAEGGSKHTVQGTRGQRVALDVDLWGGLEVSVPPGSAPITVLVDGLPHGYAPLRTDRLSPGIHRLQFSGPGVTPWEQTVEIHVNQTAQLVAQPALAPATGVLDVRARLANETGSEPLKGATVWIDGQSRGTTPMKLELPRGPHSIRVNYQGEEAPVQVIDLPGGNVRFATIELGLDVDAPRLHATLPAHIALDRPTVVSAALGPARLGDLREMWLHVRTPEGAWRRYPMNMMRAGDGVVGVCVFPSALFDAHGRTAWYVSATTPMGDEYVTEIVPALSTAAR